MDIEAAVGGGFEDSGWDEEAEGDGDDQIGRIGCWWRPGGESVDLVDGKGQGGRDGFYRDLEAGVNGVGCQ